MRLNVFKNNNLVTVEDLSEESVLDSSLSSIEFFIGRAADCHVVLDGHHISRQHAILKKTGEYWSVSNLSDFGNLYINGEAKESSELKDGDSIAIDNFVINVKIDPVSLGEVPQDGADYSMPEKESFLNTDSAEILKEPVETPLVDLDAKEKSSNEIGTDELGDLESSNVEEESELPEDEIDLDAGGNDKDLDLEINDEEEFGLDIDNEPELENLDQENVTEENNEKLDKSGSSEFQFPENDDDDYDFEGAQTTTALGDPNSDVVGFDEDKTLVAKGFIEYQLEIFGEFAPYDRFSLDQEETLIGRDPSRCSIVLNDPEVSTVHTLIKKKANIYTVEDMQSSNGTILNGSRINKAELSEGDEVLIGTTTFTVRLKSDLLKSEKNRLMPVEDDQVVEVEEVIEVEENFADTANGVTEKVPIWKQPKRLAIYGVVLFALFLVLEEEEPASLPKKKSKGAKTTKVVDKTTRNFTEEERQRLESNLLLSRELIEAGNYREALKALDQIFAITDEYKQARNIEAVAKQALAEIEESERKLQEQKRREELLAQVKDLLKSAREAVDKREVVRAEALFAKILELNPENYDVPPLKLELDNWKREQERLALEKAQKLAERKRQEGALQPGKNLFIQEKYYEAILELDKFLNLDAVDEDLVKDASDLLLQSKTKMKERLNPLLGKARSLVEGQDLKSAYETYEEILKLDPSNEESVKEMGRIKEILRTRAMKLYREAIVSESLSLFDSAREKFQQVQQVSPNDSEYYRKATKKLKEYIY